MEYIITLLPDCELLNEIFANVQIQSICVMYKKQSVFLIIILNCVIFPRQTQNQTVC